MSTRSTRLARMGRPASGWANTPIVKGSTYLFDSLEHWRDARRLRDTQRVLSYGARGNETLHALEDALTELEGGFRSQLFPTGLAAIAATLLACLKAGDHVLITEGVYEPVKRLCATQLANYGISHSYFSARDPHWERHLRPETRMVYAESPGSLLYDMLDLPAMARVCRPRGIVLCADNTWGSGLAYQPLALGCDISVVAATKYLGGHSDVMMGAVTASQAYFEAIENVSINLGQTVSADDAFLVLRGLRTLDLRMQRHAQSALEIARWLAGQPAVKTVFHPALPGDPNHDLWRRDAQGGNGLLTIEFDPGLPGAAIEAAIDRLQLFGIGSSWGGYESLVLPVDPARTRYAGQAVAPGYLLRLHIGLEDPADLTHDLDTLLKALSTLSPQQAIA
ncbi:cystathionine beta-lyase [Bordetella petrii]|uniref:cystathionine beta-lyase n=1 Tax=Bordetella petrii TaxID=94624 RepID=UPI001E3BE9D6|nr:cystathionine beta-lyase [Bordetella petrii]MCD0503247.1 cystathionine beta-lyase [Bordetella petrii]